jgi:hypothetical protein
MSHPLRTLLLSVAALLAGCVTINIYFPASAAEKAADTIIDEVWQLKGKPPTAPASPVKEKGQ